MHDTAIPVGTFLLIPGFTYVCVCVSVCMCLQINCIFLVMVLVIISKKLRQSAEMSYLKKIRLVPPSTALPVNNVCDHE